MTWSILLAIALVLSIAGRKLASQDQVYALAVYCTSTLTALWGLAIAPGSAFLTVALLALGWVQLQPRV